MKCSGSRATAARLREPVRTVGRAWYPLFMKVLVQRCLSARVEVEGRVIGEIGPGMTVFLGVATEDTGAQAVKLAGKLAGLRIFSDEAGKFNHALPEVGGAVLLISNFTLCGDARKGNRPSFTGAARPEAANALYETFAKLLEDQGIPVRTGQFGADMRVFVENDGPVNLLLEA